MNTHDIELPESGQMVEADAYLYVHGDMRGVCLNRVTEMSRYAGTVEHPLFTAESMEAYAEARVREALEKALCIVELARDSIGAGALAENAQHERSVVEPHLDGIDDEISALIPKENKS